MHQSSGSATAGVLDIAVLVWQFGVSKPRWLTCVDAILVHLCCIFAALDATLWRRLRQVGGVLGMAQRERHEVDPAGSARLVLVSGAALLRPGPAVFEAMLAGWRAQQCSRLLAVGTVLWREWTVRRFAAYTDELPWQWTAPDVEEWTSSLLSGSGHAHSTIRSYQGAVACFCDYLVDARYGWAGECETRFGTHPVQVCHEWNTAVHVADYEGRPARRPFSRTELQDFFDFADGRVAAVRDSGRKGWLAAFRDATLFKVTYAWGLRRREVAMLDAVDFSTNPAAPELGRFGTLAVRHGKAMRGSHRAAARSPR
jgi:hypothetical protein